MTDTSIGRFVGRFQMADGAMRRLPTPPRDNATMTHIGTLHGDHFSAERDGRELKLYSTTGDYGQPAQREMATEGTSGIRTTAGDARRDHGYCSDQTPASLNAMASDHYPIGIRPRSR